MIYIDLREVRPITSHVQFGPEMRRRREQSGLSLRTLSRRIPYTFGYLSKVERGEKPPSTKLATLCQEVLGGDLVEIAENEIPNPTLALAHPAELPPALSDFVGREDVLEQLSAAAARPAPPGAVRVVPVEGAPGVGKTSVIAQWTHTVREQYPDGQVFVDLRGNDPQARPAEPGNVLDDMLRSFGVLADRIPVGTEQRSRMLRSLLDARRVLMVLDNALESEQVLPLLPACEQCLVVVSSRTRLSSLAVCRGARPVTVDVLSEDEAHHLLSTVIGQRVSAEPQAARVLARRCDYLPLALRVAAEHVAQHPHHTLQELVAELASNDTRLSLLTEQKTNLRTVFGWSYHCLPESAARLFRRLGAHCGPEISLGAAAALTGSCPQQVRQNLTWLAEAHLIDAVDRDRWRVHELLRAYAAERADEEDAEGEVDGAVYRLVQWYLHSAAAANHLLAPARGLPDLPPPAPGVIPVQAHEVRDALVWCQREALNVVLAVELAHQHGHHRIAWQLAVCNFNYYFTVKRWNAWMTAHHRGLAAAGDAEDTQGQAWCLHNLAVPLLALRRYDEAQHYLDEALRLRRSNHDRWGLAWSLYLQGALSVERGRPSEARGYLDESLRCFASLAPGDHARYGRATALVALATALRMSEYLKQAYDVVEESIAIFTGLNANDGHGLALVEQGAVQHALGEDPAALSALSEAWALRDAEGDQWGTAEVLLAQGHVLTALRQYEVARQVWTEAARAFDALHDPRAGDARAQLATVDTDAVDEIHPHLKPTPRARL